MIRCLVVDDEPACCARLEKLIKTDSNLMLMNTAESVDDALSLIRREKPDLLFLDVEMPHRNGFDLLESLEEINFDVIFTTAYSKYAIQALHFSALDYLLKPIDQQDFTEAIDRLTQQHKKEVSSHVDVLISNIKTSGTPGRIVIHCLDGYSIVETNEIVSCVADSCYTTFHLRNGDKVVASKTLKEYDNLLSSEFFFRIHKSSLINLNYVKKYIKGDGGQVLMIDKSLLEVSRRKKTELLERIFRL